MKRSYQTMIFATLCLAAMVSPVAVQAQGDPLFSPSEVKELIQLASSPPPADPEEVFVPDESWPEVSSTIENWPADDPLGCK